MKLRCNCKQVDQELGGRGGEGFYTRQSTRSRNKSKFALPNTIRF